MPKQPYPSQTQDRYIVRFPSGMRDQIAETAKANNRSMNAEIIARLEASFATATPQGLHQTLLDDVVMSVLEGEEEDALKNIDLSSVEGMVTYLELVDEYSGKRERLESMMDEALLVYARRKEEKKGAPTPGGAVARKPGRPRQ